MPVALHGITGESEAAQHLSHTPRLRDTASGRKRGLSIEHFADRADARLVQMWNKPVQQTPCSRAIFRMHFQPRFDERSDQPRPNRSLVISRVARAKIAVIFCFVIL